MKYTRKAVSDRLNDIVYGDTRAENRLAFNLRLVLIAFVLVAAFSGFAFGLGALLGIIDNAPDVRSLNFSPTGYASMTYDARGNLTATLVKAGSNREEVRFEEVPDDLVNAFVAIEDQRFWQHDGIDLRSIMRAVRGVFTGDDSAGGGSTITQQLIKNNVYGGGNEKGFDLYERKFQEWYVAMELENQAGKSKEEIKKQIITDYFNTINLGNNTLGVKVAARRYFGKDVSELDLAECTVLASITKNPSRLNPLTHPEDNQKRRLQVLKNMEEQGYITSAQKKAVSGMEVYDRIKNLNETRGSGQEPYSYFTDAVIDQCKTAFKERLGLTEAQATDLLYSGGLKIITTQDPDIQKIVDEEVNDPEHYDTVKYSVEWRCSVQKKDGLVHYSEYELKAYASGINAAFDGLFASEEAARDMVEAYKKTIVHEDEGDEIIAESFDLILEPQVSFLIMDQLSREVKAVSGGRGEKKYSLTLNRATDAFRQPGSTFKVISAFAPAIEEMNATLATTYYDSRYSIGEKEFRNWWKSGQFFGYSSIRDGIEFSMNVVAVKCFVETVGTDTALGFAKAMGITSLTDDDYSPATALGGLTKGVTNLELTNAFATIANSGLYRKPLFFTQVYDHSGKLLLDMTGQEDRRVMKETTAFLLTDALEGSTISHAKWAKEDYTVYNTSSRSHLDNMPAAGKSGTTTKNVDVWFVGFTPYYTAGIWAGCDDNQSLYDAASGVYNGGTSFHKDIWNRIMTRVHEGKERRSFELPDGIVRVQVCRKSGLLPTEGCYLDIRNGSHAVYTEYFDAANVPRSSCQLHTPEGKMIIPEGYKNVITDDWSGEEETLPEETVEFAAPDAPLPGGEARGGIIISGQSGTGPTHSPLEGAEIGSGPNSPVFTAP